MNHEHDEYCGCPSPEVILHSCKENIARVGWSAIGVSGDPTFLYTVGLTETLNTPELVIVGLSPQVAHGVMARAVDIMREEGLTDGDISHSILEGFPVKIVAVSDYQNTIEFGVANVYYGHRDSEFLQLIWPDANGLFPGDEGVDEAIEKAQTLV